MSFIGELRRRSVLRVGAAYAVAAWLVIQVVETILPAFGFDEAVRNVTVVLVIGLVPALILAWVYEITPEGLKREKDVDRSRPVSPQKGRRLDRIIMVVLALGVSYFAFDKFVLEASREAAFEAEKAAAIEKAREEGRSQALTESRRDKSIAVLAFVDMSRDGDQEYLSDGIAEEILNLLARLPDVRVISRSSSFSYKGKDVKLSQIAAELGVAHVLEGSVRKAGNDVRITAQLIDARSDMHLWSATYDRTLDDIFAIQDEIAADVLAQLEVELFGTAPKARKTVPEAYSLYLRARKLGQQMNAASLAESDALYRQVLEKDPRYPPALAGIAINAFNEASQGMISGEEMIVRAREASNHALEIDPEYAPAHGILGAIARREGDPAGAARHFERALALDPADVTVLSSSAVLLSALGRLDDARVLQEALVRRDPLSVYPRFNLGLTLVRSGRFDEGIDEYRRLLSQGSERGVVHYSIGVALLLTGDPQGALDEFEQESSDIWRLLGLPMAYHALGRKNESDAALETLIERFGKDAAYNIAYVHAFRGDADRAFEWLERELALSGPGMPGIVVEQLFANIHSDPRWPEFLRRIGSSAEQLNAIAFDVSPVLARLESLRDQVPAPSR